MKIDFEFDRNDWQAGKLATTFVLLESNVVHEIGISHQAFDPIAQLKTCGPNQSEEYVVSSTVYSFAT